MKPQEIDREHERQEIKPQVTMIRAIHMRAPTFSRMTLLGTSKMK
jgi:hypothetical protein